MYNKTDVDVFYYPDLVKRFYECLDLTTINLNQHQFMVHFDSSDLLISVDYIHEFTQLPIHPNQSTQLALIDYMPLMVCGAQRWKVTCMLT